jgi:MFS family permease
MSDFSTPPPPPPPGGPATPPPGYAAYGTSAHSGYTKPIRGIAKAVVILQALAILASIAVLILTLGLTDKAKEFLDDRTNDFDDDLAGFAIAAIVSGLIALALLVLLIVWSFRIASNLQARQAVTWKPGLTIVAWILSSCTLGILPFLMLREHWNKSDDGRQGSTGGTSPLIILYLVLMIASFAASVWSGAAGVGGFSVGQTDEDVAERLTDQLGLTIASSALGIAAAVVLLLIVRQLTDRHARYTGEA